MRRFRDCLQLGTCVPAACCSRERAAQAIQHEHRRAWASARLPRRWPIGRIRHVGSALATSPCVSGYTSCNGFPGGQERWLRELHGCRRRRRSGEALLLLAHIRPQVSGLLEPLQTCRRRSSTKGGTRGVSGVTPIVWDAGCTYTVLSSTDPSHVVGEIHTPSNTSASLVYGKSADSDMGIGYSTNGSNWSVNGTIHVGNGKSAAETWDRGSSYAHRELSQFHWEKRHNHCPAGPTDFYTTVSTAWNGGAVDGGDVSQYDHQCDTTYNAYKVPQAPNTHFDRSSNNFVTWSVDTGAFGIGTSAQSGASTWVQIHMFFHQPSGTRYICGNNAAPTSSARIFSGVS